MENTEKKKKILSCIQPTGTPTLGNYLGALKNWKALEDDFDAAYAVADLHAITVRQEPQQFRKQITLFGSQAHNCHNSLCVRLAGRCF